MVRSATRFDKPEIIAMLGQFCNEFVPEYKHYFEEESTDKLLTNIIAGAGIALIAEGKGIIIGALTPCIYNQSINVLSEVAWYAKPEYRNTTVGYRLLKAYMDETDKLFKDNRIVASVMNKLPSSPDLNYEKYGFKKMQESWVK